MILSSIRSCSVISHNRLDAHFFNSPGVEAIERIRRLNDQGTETVTLGSIARIWSPARFARAYAAPSEPSVPYLRPYDVFDYLPVADDHLSVTRNDDVERLRPTPGTLLQTCSGRNLGPCTYADEHIAQFALSHDMIRIEIDDLDMRAYALVFLKTPTGQALLRRGKSGSVIDHLTNADVSNVPLPILPEGVRHKITHLASRSIEAASQARSLLSRILGEQAEELPPSARTAGTREGWTLPSKSLGGRIDAAFYDPIVATARQQVAAAGGVQCGDLADVTLPVRYKRYYVSREHGRPILSGRQILQLEPVNLRYVSDRSFRDPRNYVIKAGMTIFGADGRAEGSQGAASLVTAERSDWLASNHVMRLTPRTGIRPATLWLAIAARQSRIQINALSFGSVVDQVNPGDVERIVLPPVSDSGAMEVERAWLLFGEAAATMNEAVSQLELHLSFDSDL